MLCVNKIKVLFVVIIFILEYFICIFFFCKKLYSWNYFILSFLLNFGDKCNLFFYKKMLIFNCY